MSDEKKRFEINKLKKANAKLQEQIQGMGGKPGPAVEMQMQAQATIRALIDNGILSQEDLELSYQTVKNAAFSSAIGQLEEHAKEARKKKIVRPAPAGKGGLLIPKG